MRSLHPPLEGEGRGPQGRGVGCSAMQGVAARYARFHPNPPRFAIADAPRRRSLRRRTAAEGRLRTFPLQGKVGRKKGSAVPKMSEEKLTGEEYQARRNAA